VAPPHPAESVILDSDGLVFNTSRQWQTAERRLFARYGVAHHPDTSDALFGRGRSDAEEILADLLGAPRLEAPKIFNELEFFVVEELVRGCDTMPGARDLVTALAASEVSVGLVSNSPRPVVAALVATLGEHGGEFDAIVTGDDVTRHKPLPDIYCLACDRLSADPTRSIAVEDSPIGVAAAASAGMFVIYVPSKPEARAPREANVTVDSLRSDRLQQLLVGAGVLD
jgi:HAD superfamily hydrolase (TIGR01509 family)